MPVRAPVSGQPVGPETSKDEAAASRQGSSDPPSSYTDVPRHGYIKLGAELVNSESSSFSHFSETRCLSPNLCPQIGNREVLSARAKHRRKSQRAICDVASRNACRPAFSYTVAAHKKSQEHLTPELKVSRTGEAAFPFTLWRSGPSLRNAFFLFGNALHGASLSLCCPRAGSVVAGGHRPA